MDSVQDRLISRLRELEAEYEAGERRLHVLEAESVRLRETMLRISGAIQVLQELLKSHAAGSQNQDDVTNTSITPAPVE